MLIEFFSELNPIIQALIATLFTWFVTALGAGLVFFFKSINRKTLDAMLGFAAGVMIAASYWSLFAPAIEMAEGSDLPAWIPATAGFLLGGAFLWLIDKLLPHLHPGFPKDEAEGVSTSWQRSVLLVLAITIHNIRRSGLVTPDFDFSHTLSMIPLHIRGTYHKILAAICLPYIFLLLFYRVAGLHLWDGLSLSASSLN